MRFMKLFAVIAALLAASAPTGAAAQPEKLWELSGFYSPESVLHDPAEEVLYVSNVNGSMLDKDGNGSISKISPDGRMIEAAWVDGLNAPKGLGLSGGVLYVADIDELVAIDVAEGTILERYPADGAVFLNDVVAHPDGRIFVSDTATNTIWVLQDGELTPWLSDPGLMAPNGLVIEDDDLVVAPIGELPQKGSAGTPANLVTVSLEDKSLRDLGDGTPVGYLDGLAALGEGMYLASDFGQGALYRIAASGSYETLIDFAPGTADFAYLSEGDVVVMPLSNADRLVAYRLP